MQNVFTRDRELQNTETNNLQARSQCYSGWLCFQCKTGAAGLPGQVVSYNTTAVLRRQVICDVQLKFPDNAQL